jgi:D-glycerate 3-kinase
VDKANWINSFIEAERLPQSYADLAVDYFIPYADELVLLIKERCKEGIPLHIGVNGAQGTGKTTFAKFLSSYLVNFYCFNGSHISLDDFYLTKTERQKRAREIHPLFLVRGVPGTHDIALAISTFKKLKALKSNQEMSLPCFDKASDDRMPAEKGPKAIGVQNFIIFEGWCVGSRSVPSADLALPINSIGEDHKTLKVFGALAINDYLRQDYQKLFSIIDKLIFLKAPDFATVLKWRSKQEEKLMVTRQKDQSHTMSNDDIARFIEYFERITRDNLKIMPDIADIVFEFNSEPSNF